MALLNPDVSIHERLARRQLQTARKLDRRKKVMRGMEAVHSLIALRTAVRAAQNAEFAGNEKLLMDSVRLVRALQEKALRIMHAKRQLVANPKKAEALDRKDEAAVMAEVRKAQKGDREAFGRLYSAHYDLVHKVALKCVKGGVPGPAMLADIQNADDVAQSSMLKVMEKIKGFKGESKFSTWLYKVVERECFDWSKQMGFRRKAGQEHGRRRQMAESKELQRIEVSAGAQAIAAAVVAALRDLKKPARDLLLLADAEGLTTRDIEARTGKSKSAVAESLSAARGDFQRLIHRKLAPVDDVKELEKMSPQEQVEKFELEKMRLAAMEQALTKAQASSNPRPRRNRSGSLMRRVMRI